MDKFRGLSKAGLSVVVACFCWGGLAVAAGEAGSIKTVKGSVSIVRGGQKQAATVGSAVLVSDRIVTGADSAVGMTLRDNTLLSAGPNSTLELNKYVFDATTHGGELDATVKRGTLSVISGKLATASPRSVSFNTPTATLGVRGTEFVIEVSEGEQE